MTDAQRGSVVAIMAQHLSGEAVWLSGSRATGRARPFSDLDRLIAPAQPLTWAQRAALRDAFEGSSQPFRVDIVELNALAPGMRARVGAERVPPIGP